MAIKDFKGFTKNGDIYNCYDTDARAGLTSQTQLLEDTVGWTGKELATTITPDHAIGQSGNVSENAQFDIIEYMEVIEGDTYVFRGTFEGEVNRNNRIHGYNSSKVWVQQIAVQNTSSNVSINLEFTIPSGVKYIRMSIGDSCTSYSIKHLSVDEQKTDNSVIAPVENGATASKVYIVGEHFMRNGQFATATSPIASGDTLTEGTNYTVGDVAKSLSLLQLSNEYLRDSNKTTHLLKFSNGIAKALIIGSSNNLTHFFIVLVTVSSGGTVTIEPIFTGSGVTLTPDNSFGLTITFDASTYLMINAMNLNENGFMKKLDLSFS